MTVCAVMLVKDEADIIEPVLRHLAWHVDEIHVADNLSKDGSRALLDELAQELPLLVTTDEEIGYYQDRKTTALAMAALARGHRWVVPCDADEVWHCGDPARPIRELLGGLSPDVMIVNADLFNHLPSALDDPDDPNPLTRIGWRQRFVNGRKVACRLRPDLEIGMGNHSARTSGTALAVGGLNVRHFSWRTADQYARKVINGALAYAETDYPEGIGVGWRMFGKEPHPLMLREHFETWFYAQDPEADETLIYDPAPVMPPVGEPEPVPITEWGV